MIKQVFQRISDSFKFPNFERTEDNSFVSSFITRDGAEGVPYKIFEFRHQFEGQRVKIQSLNASDEKPSYTVLIEKAHVNEEHHMMPRAGLTKIQTPQKDTLETVHDFCQELSLKNAHEFANIVLNNLRVPSNNNLVLPLVSQTMSLK